MLGDMKTICFALLAVAACGGDGGSSLSPDAASPDSSAPDKVLAVPFCGERTGLYEVSYFFDSGNCTLDNPNDLNKAKEFVSFDSGPPVPTGCTLAANTGSADKCTSDYSYTCPPYADGTFAKTRTVIKWRTAYDGRAGAEATMIIDYMNKSGAKVCGLAYNVLIAAK